MKPRRYLPPFTQTVKFGVDSTGRRNADAVEIAMTTSSTITYRQDT